MNIYSAITDMPWPGDAGVTVSIVHLERGSAKASHIELNGKLVRCLDSRLDAKQERPHPHVLKLNGDLSFIGCKIGGQGFVLTPEERERLIASSARNQERIFLYVGGEDVNTHPRQLSSRYVIDFGKLSEDEATAWPELLQIVREKVKPYRDSVNRESWRKRWWQFAEVYPAMRAAVAPLSRCLVCSAVTKHLVFSFQPTERVPSHKLYVFPFDKFTPFAVLQSRIHSAWTWLLSSTLEERLNYSASDCFETFPFPAEDPRAALPELEALGEGLYNARAAFMVDTDQGLTKTYNALKDPACVDERILALRVLHERLDAAVLAAYGWTDVAVPPYCVATDADRAALQAFEDEIIDRLFVLNAERAKKETALGRGKAPKAKGPAAPRKLKGDAPAAAKRAKKAPKESPPSGQGNLGWE